MVRVYARRKPEIVRVVREGDPDSIWAAYDDVIIKYEDGHEGPATLTTQDRKLRQFLDKLRLSDEDRAVLDELISDYASRVADDREIDW